MLFSKVGQTKKRRVGGPATQTAAGQDLTVRRSKKGFQLLTVWQRGHCTACRGGQRTTCLGLLDNFQQYRRARPVGIFRQSGQQAGDKRIAVACGINRLNFAGGQMTQGFHRG